MKFIVLLLLATSVSVSQVNFDDYFLNKSLRVDFYHTGDAQIEIISFDEMIEEPYWGGSHVNLIDDFKYGNYFLEVYDFESNRLIYSRGFSTLFQEWQTTAQSKKLDMSFSGSVSFPFPKNKIVMKLFRRDRKNNFNEIFDLEISPDDYFIKNDNRKQFENFKIHFSGDSKEKLDIVFIPDGYTKEEMDKFRNDCKRFSDYLFNYEPFKSSPAMINTWGIAAPSDESGTDIPGEDIWVNTLLNSSFYTFDSERYLMTTDYKSVKDLAANAPYDQIIILVNTDKYGGGGIYNFYLTTAADHPVSEKIFIHEFGHSFAGLADEYYTSDVSYEDFYPLDVEPWEPNITTMVDFESKWKNIINSETPIPTPNEDSFKDVIGAFEGAGYMAKGIYRSSLSSIMITLSAESFNEVSKDVLGKLIKFYAE
ncbi:MAG: IgA Peptidase M64 [Melioribacteraceae bacterium]|nr:IgA Peptidase M64 [Melioribacteraceae bacterium]MCF8352849.1 IgA Peptidase M64 [Melioribacteraceae bacterium]MCF8417366.1 IgA Peptidase M64 [Melioribacteraceae bacterium]